MSKFVNILSIKEKLSKKYNRVQKFDSKFSLQSRQLRLKSLTRKQSLFSVFTFLKTFPG